MLHQHPAPAWRRLALAALALAALPLLTTWQWWPTALQPVVSIGDYSPPGGSWERPDQIVVDLRDDAPQSAIAALGQRFGLRLSDRGDNPHRIVEARVDPAQSASLLEQLRRDPLVEVAEPLRLYTALYKPNDPRYQEQWNFNLIGMEKAWDTTRGKGATVAVIDTGVAIEKDAKCYRARDFEKTEAVKGYDFVNGDEHPADDHGHGTHVAGTIAESTNNNEGVAGIAFEAKIMPLKVLSAEGWGTSADIAKAIRWAADHGADVINMSLGSPVPDRLMEEACRDAYKKGVAIVCAAGNSGREGVGYPAAFPQCIAVSAVGPSGELTFYSSWGKQVAIAAPGGDQSVRQQDGILQNTVMEGQDDYYYFQGTSMASPHVAGVAALIVSRGVHNPAQVRQVLEKSARVKQPKNKYGAGILDAAAAVQKADEEQSEPRSRFLFALLLAALGLAVARYRARFAGHGGLPVAATGVFLLGMLLPEWLAGGFGTESAWNILGHSALIPMALLGLGLAHRPALRLLAALAAGFAAHLLWDGFHAAAPFSYEAGWRVMPWLWVNAGIGLGVAVAALRKGYREG